jgi:tetratricopeptide (TPR) repeat protein
MSASALSVWFWRQMSIWAGLLKRDAMALEYIERIAQACPQDPQAISTLAHARGQRGGRDEAIRLFERALALDPKRAADWYNLGYLLQDAQRHDEAIAAMRRAIALNEKLDLAHYGLALSLIKTDRLEEAIEPLKRNIALQPMSPYGFYQLAHVHHRLGHPKEAVALIRRLAGFEPQVARQLQRETGLGTDIVTR